MNAPIRIATIDAGGASPRRRTLSLEGGIESVVTSRTVVAALCLEPDQVHPSRDALVAAIHAAEPQFALERAFDILSHHDRSVTEMRRALAADGYGHAAVDGAVARITELGYLDDRGYAERQWRSSAGTGKGRQRIVADLRRRGIDPDVIAEAERELRENADLPTEHVLAQRWVQRWGGAPDDRKERDRMVRKLVTRGFSFDVALRALEASHLDDSE